MRQLNYAQAIREAHAQALESDPRVLVLGQGFDYPAYRDQVLRQVKDKYYAVPSYLPMGICYFCERYFPNETSRHAALIR